MMKVYFKSFLGLLFILFFGYNRLANAQEKTQAINLETVLKIGGANNLTIQEYKKRQELALANVIKIKEWWLPDIYAGTTIHQLWGSSMNGDGRFFTDVNRQNFWGGIGLNAVWDFGDGIFKSNAAELKAQAAVFETQAEQNKALLNTINTYYDFLAAQLYFKAYKQLAAEAKTIADQIGIQVEAGLRYESEKLLAKSNYHHLKVEMLNAKIQHNNKSATLVRLLNLDPNLKLVGTDSILAPLELVQAADLDYNVDSAYSGRPEIKRMGLIVQSLNEEKKVATTGLLFPELRLGTYGSVFGDVFTPVNPTSAVNAALIWKIPISRFSSNGSIKQFDARIVLQETLMEQSKAQINEEVISARAQIAISKEQIEVSQEGSKLSEQALQQSIARQQMGTVRPFEILQAQEIYIKSRLDYLKAVASFNKAQYAYYVAVGNNL